MVRESYDTYGSRLRAAMLAAKRTNARGEPDRAWLSHELSISPQAVGQALKDVTIFTAENHMKAARALNCNPYWLATGEEDMQAPSTRWPFETVKLSEVTSLGDRMLARLETTLKQRLAELLEDADDAGKEQQRRHANTRR